MYIVVNIALHSDSSYYDIVNKFTSLEDARQCMQCEVSDTMKAIDNDYFGKDFNSMNIKLAVNEKSCKIQDTVTGFFEYWEIYKISDDTVKI